MINTALEGACFVSFYVLGAVFLIVAGAAIGNAAGRISKWIKQYRRASTAGARHGGSTAAGRYYDVR